MSDDLISAIAYYLARSDKNWDFLSINKIPDSSILATRLPLELSKYRLQNTLLEEGANPAVSLAGDWNAYYSRRSRRLKKGNNHLSNRLNRAFERVELSCLSRDTVVQERVENLVEEVVCVSSKSWKTKTGTSLDNPGPRAFIEKLTQLAYANDWLLVWVLSLDGETVATEYQLAYKRQVHALRSDFDHSYNDFSPGSYLNWKLLESLFDSGMETYLMGHGKNPYKIRWAEEFSNINRLVCYGPTYRGQMALLIGRKIKPYFKRFLEIMK
jgi:CelD/BcsL family acetyltransferase involved in cellulose biosynthesis